MRSGKGSMSYSSLGQIAIPSKEPLKSPKPDDTQSIQTEEKVETKSESGFYDGDWHLDWRHGKGVMTWSDNSKFEGQWVQDQRYKGKMYLSNGHIYEGGFKNDEFYGKGKILFADDSEFKGFFKNANTPLIGRFKNSIDW